MISSQQLKPHSLPAGFYAVMPVFSPRQARAFSRLIFICTSCCPARNCSVLPLCSITFLIIFPLSELQRPSLCGKSFLSSLSWKERGGLHTDLSHLTLDSPDLGVYGSWIYLPLILYLFVIILLLFFFLPGL